VRGLFLLLPLAHMSGFVVKCPMDLNTTSSEPPDIPDTSYDTVSILPEIDVFSAAEDDEYSAVIRPRKNDKAEDMICRLEARLHEMRTANASNMSELMYIYSRGATLCARRQVEEEAVVSALTIEKKSIAALVTLDKAPEALKKRGLLSTRSPGGSADTREAVLDSDPEYQSVLRKIARSEARAKLYGIRQAQFERAYYGVKTSVPENPLGNRFKPEIGVNPRG